MKKEKGPEYYDEIYRSSEKYRVDYRGSRRYAVWAQAMRFVKEFVSPKILEIGCGTGQFAHYLYDEGFRDYHGVDFSPEAVELAKKTTEQSFSVGDCRNGDIFDRDYDLVIALELLEHVKDDHAVISNIRQGTGIIFSLPRFNDPAHVRKFRRPQDIENRYCHNIDIKEIVRVDKWFVCWGKVVNRYKPRVWGRLLRICRILK